jgi:hypothetical protein
MADGRTKRIGDIRPGERVLSYSERGHKIVAATVLARTEAIPRDVVAVRVEGSEKRIVVSPNHRFFVVDGGWTSVEKIPVGARLTGLAADAKGLQSVRLVERENLNDHVPVFNMTIEDTQCYFAGGMLVHNNKVGGVIRLGAVSSPF